MSAQREDKRQADTVPRFWFFDMPGYEAPPAGNPEAELYWDNTVATYWDGTPAEYWNSSP